MKPRTFLAALFSLTSTAPHDAFVSELASPKKPRSSLYMTKRKPSMAEKRKQRQAKQLGQHFQNPFASQPKSNLDFQGTGASKALDTPDKLRSPTEGAEKAKELLKAQRASVDMLTKVRTRIEALPSEEIMAALGDHGFFTVDNLLGDENILSQLEAEAIQLYEAGELEIDVANLGSGEYTTVIKGGSEQYAKCPRLVEWTVSTTKHLPEHIMEPSLDSSACMAILRTFDRKAFQASLSLLAGSEDIPEANKPFATVVSDLQEDRRRISLQYFIVPEAWNQSCGGSISWECGDMTFAKRDRLVIWRSDTTSLRKDMWKGKDDIPLASCLELHLLGKAYI
jgi:hypothetical protein